MSAENTKTISLVKGSGCFAITYELGQEKNVLDELIVMVKRTELAFDWYDAACLSHQLGQHLAKELEPYSPNGKH